MRSALQPQERSGHNRAATEAFAPHTVQCRSASERLDGEQWLHARQELTLDGHLPSATNDKEKSRAAHRAKINSSDPPLTAVSAAYLAEPFLPVIHPPIEMASFGPRGRLYLDRWIDFPAISLGTLL